MKNIFDGRSEIRNKVVARVFKELKYIERWGSGIKRMIDSCDERGLKKSKFKESGDSVEVIFYRLDSQNFEDQSGVNDLDFTNQEKQIVDYLIKHESINRQNVEEILNVKNTRARVVLNDLRDKDSIVMKGNGPKTYYILNNQLIQNEN